jgi:hypothetical protein
MAFGVQGIIPGKRYRRSNGTYVEDARGRYLGKRVMWVWIGVLDLGIKTVYGYPTNPATGKTYIEEGFSTDD